MSKPSTRASRRDARAEAEVALQLPELAFTVSGYAMEDGMLDRQGPEIILGYPASGYKFLDILAKAKKDGATSEERNVFRIGGAHSDRELGEIEGGLKRYAVVGYAPRDPLESKLLSKMISSTDKGLGKAIGTKTPPDVKAWDNNEPPFIVVTEITATKPLGLQLYALMKPVNGLCTPFVISQSQVYYRYEFRTNVANLPDRRTTWNANVMKHSVRPAMLGEILTEKQEKVKRARDPVRLVIHPNVSLAHEMLSLAAYFKQHKQSYHREEMKAVLKHVNDDLNYVLHQNTGFRLFVEEESNVDEEQAEQVISDFSRMWPRSAFLDVITVPRIILLKKALLGTDILLQYKDLKGFLVDGCRRLSKLKSPPKGKKLIELILDVQQTCLAYSESGAPNLAPEASALIITTQLHKLREITSAARNVDRAVKDSFGDVALDYSPDDVFDMYGKACDTDAAKLIIQHNLRLATAVYKHKDAGLHGMIDELIEPMAKANLDGTGRAS